VSASSTGGSQRRARYPTRRLCARAQTGRRGAGRPGDAASLRLFTQTASPLPRLLAGGVPGRGHEPGQGQRQAGDRLRIELPGSIQVINTEYVGSFDDAKKGVDAAVRFERVCATQVVVQGSLPTAGAGLADPPDLDGRRHTADASRPVQGYRARLQGQRPKPPATETGASSPKEVDAAAQYKRTRDARALAAAATMGRPRGWRTHLTLRPILLKSTTPGGATPSTASLVQALGAGTVRCFFSPLDACLVVTRKSC
jgi:hypothetical protein